MSGEAQAPALPPRARALTRVFARATPSSRPLAVALLSFAVVVLYGAFHFRAEMFAADVRTQGDLAGYLRTFDNVEAGRPVYTEVNYLYTPVFAIGGNRLYRALGPDTFVTAYRCALLLAVWLLVWGALRPLRLSLVVQTVAMLALVTFSSALWNGIHCANATLLLGGPVFVALLAGERRPLLAGLVAGTINAWKPLAVAALAVVCTPFRRLAPRRWQWILAGGALVGLVAWLTIGADQLPVMLSRARGFPEQSHQLSIHRALYQLGIEVPATAVFLAVTALGCLLVHRRGADHHRRVAIAMAFSALSVPVVNPSTLLLALPVQALALDRALARWRPASGARPRLALAELAIVVAATVGSHGGLGAVVWPSLPPLVGGLVTLIPHLDTAVLCLYALGGERLETVEEVSTPRGSVRASAADAPAGT